MFLKNYQIKVVRELKRFFQTARETSDAIETARNSLPNTTNLIEKLNEAVSIVKSSGFEAWDSSGESAREYIAHAIARYFEVSEQVIDKRLIRENLWPPTRK